jgi:hypothetical protein
MRPDKSEADKLVESLKSRHGLRFDELSRHARQFADFLKKLDSFRLVDLDPLLQHQHVGRVIVDGVFQVGHDFEKQVRKRVECIAKYPEAATVSGFIRLLKEKGISQLLDWKSPGMQEDLLSVANFFSEQGIETYSELQKWLIPEDHRDSLLSDQSRLGGNTTFRVAEKTADYFRLLVNHWDAVAVDKGIGQLLAKAEIVSLHSTKFDYKEKRTILQLTALELDCRPIDLDHSIYVYYVNNKSKDTIPRSPKKRRRKDFMYCFHCGHRIRRDANYCTECGKSQV